MIKKIILFILEAGSGFISVWWLIISLAMAINPDHKADTVFLMPFGYIFLIILFLIVAGGNYFLYKKHNNKRVLLIWQIVPFCTGLIVAISQTV